MDSIGHPQLSWARGYNGGIAKYIDHKTVAYACGNNVNFVKQGGESSIFTSPGEGVATLDVHPLNKMFAFSELCLNPRILVFSYPSMEKVSELKDGAQLEYTDLVFSSSDYLITVSGIPEYRLILWDYTKPQMLLKIDLPHVALTSLSVNPGNWRQICVSTAETFTVYTVEQSDIKFGSVSKNVKLFSNNADGTSGKQHEATSQHADSMFFQRLEVDLSPSAIAGLYGKEADLFEVLQDPRPRCIPVSQAWTPQGDIIVGCKDGQLLKVDGELWSVKALFLPPAPKMSASSHAAQSEPFLRETSIREEDEEITSADFTHNMAGIGSFNCLALHKQGLYAGGEDGTLRCYSLNNDGAKLLDSYPLDIPITSLNFSTNWTDLHIGSSKGKMFCYDINNLGNVREFLDYHAGNFLAIKCLAPGLEHAVTVREDGFLQVWKLADGAVVSTLPLGIEATTMSCSPIAPIVVIGTTSGFLFVVDFTNLQSPRVVHRARPTSTSLTRIVYTAQGQYILLGCPDGNIIIMSGRAAQSFKILGYTSVDGAVETITSLAMENSPDVRVVVSSNPTGSIQHGATKLVAFELRETVMSTVEAHYNSLKGDIRDEAINKFVFNFASPSYGACLASWDILYSLAQDNKKLQKLIIPKERPKKPNSKDSFLVPEIEFEAHQLAGGKIQLSPHQKWLASVGADGKLQVRTVGIPEVEEERVVEVHPHDYRHGGVKAVSWSAGGQHILTAGRGDGILCCYTWKFTPSGESKGKSALSAAKLSQNHLSDVIMKERDALKIMQEWTTPETSRPAVVSVHSIMSNTQNTIKNDEIYSTPTPVTNADSTWLEIRQHLAHTEEDKQYSDVKKELRTEIKKMRVTLQGLMEQNKVAPDIEKLQHHDFDLDLDEQERLHAVGETELQRIREEIEFENLAKQYLTYLIKQECWDSMEVKGRSIEGFSVTLEVQNYPMNRRSRQELDELARCVALRRIEMAEAKARSELIEVLVPKVSQTAIAGDEGTEEDETKTEAPSITGSMGSLFGGRNELFYNQFELYSREQKVNQIILLKDAIHRIKLNFNKEFDELLMKKEQEAAKINEKNKRIAKIFGDLDMMDTVKVHPVSTKEKPELLLTVDDSEVTVEKYLTPEQKKIKEEMEKHEEERKQRERGDNARERALDHMMGGVLEIKKEDELKKDVPIPLFIQNKPQEEWTEDEQKIAKEYERKVKELIEERDKYRKQLEAELKKLQLLISESEQAFNDTLRQVFVKRLKVEMVICQEELKVLRIQYSLMLQQALETRQRQLQINIEHKKKCKLLAAEAYIQARKNVDNFKEGYDILVAEDKVMDKGFKREFSDVTALQLDQLYKLFRKRPRGQKAFHNRGETPILDATSGNPFAERPSTSRQNVFQRQAMEVALADLDKVSNAPDGVEIHVWERLCNYRRVKTESEWLVKQKALVMADMMAFQQKRQDEDMKLAEEIEDLSIELSKLKEAMQRHLVNLEVQLLMKQGQVELDGGAFIHHYDDSVLIHRSVVEDLNGRIKALGESKIASMTESKEFRKGIIQLEWEHKKNLMKIEDLKNKMRDINMMKVTREIQSYLSEADHDATIAQEVSILEQTILLQKQHHEMSVDSKKKILAELKRTIKDKEIENNVLLREIEELNVSVNERQHIYDVSADKNVEGAREKRYQEIVQRRKLVDLAKVQANEVAVLRAEVERLRMRTFPALVQVER